MEYMCSNQTDNISTLNGSALKLVDKFTYLGSSVSSTETGINTWLAKAWTVIDRLSVICKSNLADKRKCNFFHATVMLILLYGCTTWTLTKRLEKKLDGNYTRMLWAILNKSWRQHPTKQQLYGHLPPITKTIQVRWTRNVGHCWRSKDKLISNVLLWTPSHGQAKARRPARTYTQQLCVDMGCSPEDLLEAMDDGEGWRERVRDIHADSATWWWRYISSLSSSHADSMDSLDSVLPSAPISHCFRQFLLTASGVYTELMNVSFCSLTNAGMSIYILISLSLLLQQS